VSGGLAAVDVSDFAGDLGIHPHSVTAAQNRILNPSVREDLLQPRLGVRDPVEVQVPLQVSIVRCRVERLLGDA
jgi:hypothetical protein